VKQDGKKVKKHLWIASGLILFVNTFVMIPAGFVHLTSGLLIHPTILLLSTMSLIGISFWALSYFGKFSHEFTEREPGLLEFSSMTQRLILESQTKQLKDDLKLYLSVYEKSGEEFSKDDLEEFKIFREMLQETRQ